MGSYLAELNGARLAHSSVGPVAPKNIAAVGYAHGQVARPVQESGVSILAGINYSTTRWRRECTGGEESNDLAPFVLPRIQSQTSWGGVAVTIDFSSTPVPAWRSRQCS